MRDCGVSEDNGHTYPFGPTLELYTRLTPCLRRRAGGAHKKCRPHGFEYRLAFRFTVEFRHFNVGNLIPLPSRLRKLKSFAEANQRSHEGN